MLISWPRDDYLSHDTHHRSCWANGSICAYCPPFIFYDSYHNTQITDWRGVPRSLYTIARTFLDYRRLNACIMTCSVGRWAVDWEMSSKEFWPLFGYLVSPGHIKLLTAPHSRLYVDLSSTTAVHAMTARWTSIAFLCMFWSGASCVRSRIQPLYPLTRICDIPN